MGGYKRIIKDHGAILLFSIQPFTSDLIQSNRKMFRYEIVWKKTQPLGFLNANRMPLKTHENILVFYKHLPTYNPIKGEAKRRMVNIGRKRIKKLIDAFYTEMLKSRIILMTAQDTPAML